MVQLQIPGALNGVQGVAGSNPVIPCRVLDGKQAAAINADLTTGLDLTRAAVLPANADLCFQGPVKVGDFDVSFELAASMLLAPNPHGRPNSDVLRPWLYGKGITDLIPTSSSSTSRSDRESAAALYESPFAHVVAHVWPVRAATRRERRRHRWWQHGETVPTWRGSSPSR